MVEKVGSTYTLDNMVYKLYFLFFFSQELLNNKKEKGVSILFTRFVLRIEVHIYRSGQGQQVAAAASEPEANS